MDNTNFGGLMIMIVAAILAIILLLWAALRPANSNPSSATHRRRWFRPNAAMEDDETSVAPHRMDRLRTVHDQCKPAPTSYAARRDTPTE